MIDIKRLHQLEKEVQDTHDQIIRQVWLVHHIIGRFNNFGIGVLSTTYSLGYYVTVVLLFILGKTYIHFNRTKDETVRLFSS